MLKIDINNKLYLFIGFVFCIFALYFFISNEQTLLQIIAYFGIGSSMTLESISFKKHYKQKINIIRSILGFTGVICLIIFNLS